MNFTLRLDAGTLGGLSRPARRRKAAAPAKVTTEYSPEVVDAILAIDQAGRVEESMSAEEAIALIHSWM